MPGERRSHSKILMTILALGALFFVLSGLVLAPRMDHATEEFLAQTRESQLAKFDALDRMAQARFGKERTLHVAVADDGYARPAPAYDGAYDAETALEPAARRVVERILAGEPELASTLESGDRALLIRPRDGQSESDLKAALQIAMQFRARGVPASIDRQNTDHGRSFMATDRLQSGLGRLLELRDEFAGRSHTVLIDPEQPAIAAPGRDRRARIELSFKTDHQTQAIFAREDAFEILENRVCEEIWKVARSRWRLAADDRETFFDILLEHFPKALLVDLGMRDLRSVHKVLEGDATGAGETDVYQVEVAWAADEVVLARVAGSVEDYMAARRREPWVRGGLALGAVLLGVLGWFKVDWWLKGRHAFLTKLVCGILAILGVLLSLELPFHV